MLIAIKVSADISIFENSKFSFSFKVFFLGFVNKSNDPTISELTTSTPSIDISGASNKPPEIVMSKALSAASLIISDETLPLAGIPVYLALYFSEPQRLVGNARSTFP